MNENIISHEELAMTSPTIKISARNVDVHYDKTHAIRGVSAEIPSNSVTAFIGPSGCGKSTFLRCLNRMNDKLSGKR